MMTGDNFTEEVCITRVALGDLTNRPVKRNFSSISDDLGSQSECSHHKIVVTGDQNLHLAKQSAKTKIGDDNGDEKGLLLEEDKQASDSSATETDIDTSQGNAVSVVSNRSNENKEAPNLLDSSVNFLTRGTVTKSVDEVGDASRDSCDSTGSMPACSWSGKKDCDEEGRLSSDVKQKNTAINFCTSVEKDLDVVKLANSLCGSFESSMLPKSQGSKSFELDRCTTLKGDGHGCANFSAGGADLLKACNCSFCMKAAYIWSDLHYQDIKGRLGVLKKSQKEASILANKYAREKQTEIHTGNLNKSSNLESNLAAQWKSLFHHMEDIFVQESNQLQAGYVALKDMRENCKTDLERTNGMPSNKYE
ncbi:uncharacterized protein [Euphorbia lathyris]|uniref:uncharacterized protein n=1 Tax=Euphorbia lathyris TaxID=212925 RepID=UPI003313FBBC